VNIFKLPDLGEGLVEAEIVEWHVATGDEVKEDQPLVGVETAKAIVDIPSPRSGRIAKRYGEPGEIVHVGDPLVEFEGAGETLTPAPPAARREDQGSVVGHMQVGGKRIEERAAAVGHAAPGVKATPAVRALAHRLGVDLSIVTPSGPDGMVTVADVQRVAKILAEVGPLQPLRGVRRAMAHAMAQAHAEVAAVTVSDDADIEAWRPNEDVTLRLIRAIAAACKAEPSLNAWYDSRAIGRRLLDKLHLGIAIDTEDGLFVAVVRNADSRSRAELRRALDELKRKVRERSIPPEELRGYTFTLSNFGTFAGRYADPVVVPPTVGILGAGRIRPEVVAAEGRPAVHHILPLSLSFDHRAVTGGEAARFLAAVIRDLQRPE
jgi:2-oxoisovalerate dehydrogenase E2 component (dihydrolipoyl transacylase)